MDDGSSLEVSTINSNEVTEILEVTTAAFGIKKDLITTTGIRVLNLFISCSLEV